MNNPSRVEFVTRTVTATHETIARRRDVIQRLDDLDQVDASAGEVNTTDQEWVARIGGTEMPVLDWSVQKLDDGRVAVSLVAIVDAVAAGDLYPEVITAPLQNDDSDQDRSDERDRLIADRLNFAEQAQHDHTLERWTCGCNPVLLGIQAAAKTGNIDVRVVRA